MTVSDGRRLLDTSSRENVAVERCTRWEELREAVIYHAQLATLLNAPTKFVLLNDPDMMGEPHGYRRQEMSIGQRGSQRIEEDLKSFLGTFARIEPGGATPLTKHLVQIYKSIQHLQDKIVLVLATDGRPTDSFGYSSTSVDRAFEEALRQIQSKAWVVVRLCTDDSSTIQYYQQLDEHMELSLEVLDDYLDEAKEVYYFNPWLTYSLPLHRCREMGLSVHSLHRWLDWLDERPLTRQEICQALGHLGIANWRATPSSLEEPKEWQHFCDEVKRSQKELCSRDSLNGSRVTFSPWNPIRRKTTLFIDIDKLRRHGSHKSNLWKLVVAILGVVLAIALRWWQFKQ